MQAYLSPLTQQMVDDLVKQAMLSTPDRNDPLATINTLVQLLMLEWNGQLVAKYEAAARTDRRKLRATAQ